VDQGVEGDEVERDGGDLKKKSRLRGKLFNDIKLSKLQNNSPTNTSD